MNEKFLPIGTVVLLKGANKKLMVTGFGVKNPEDNKIYDYSGCTYPEGIIDSRSIFLFNHSQIEKFFYMGYLNEEGIRFKSYLSKKVK